MLTAADLKPPKKECWINVYRNGEYGYRYSSRYMAITRAIVANLAYRIHVILK